MSAFHAAAQSNLKELPPRLPRYATGVEWNLRDPQSECAESLALLCFGIWQSLLAEPENLGAELAASLPSYTRLGCAAVWAFGVRMRIIHKINCRTRRIDRKLVISYKCGMYVPKNKNQPSGVPSKKNDGMAGHQEAKKGYGKPRIRWDQCCKWCFGIGKIRGLDGQWEKYGGCNHDE